MNYTPKEDDNRLDGDENIEDYDAWARNFIKATTSRTSTSTKQQKMGSSAITNILPRMERLNGPYGMYATVYGIQTKVVHIAHPVPARAVLTGSGVIEVGDICGSSNNNLDDKQKEGYSSNKHQLRRKSSTLRLLSGSTKYPAYDHFKNFSGNGVFTADGSDWKAKRASVLHCLVRGWNTDNLLEIEANKAADSFEREVLDAMIQSHRTGEECTTMNVVPMLQRSTIGLIYRLITHQDTDFSLDGINDTVCSSQSLSTATLSSTDSTIDNNDTSLRDRTTDDGPCNESKIKMLLPLYLESVTKIRMILLAQSRSFWYLVPRWVYKLFSPMYREEERTMGPIREFARLTCENASPQSPLAQLSQRPSHSTKRGDDDDSTISKDLLDEAITLLFAGQDTSAATLSWTLHLLSLNPKKRLRLEEEVRSVLQRGNSTDNVGNTVTKTMISQMPYLDAVIKESMRLYPVAPFIVRKLTTDVTIPGETGKEKDTATSLPASTFACIWIYSLHRNPKLWDRPDEFLPERWIDSELRSKDVGQQEYGAYMPFAIGPRNCLGQPLAQVILRILLARIVRKYTVLDPRSEALKTLKSDEGIARVDERCLRKDMQAGFTVLPSNGLKLQLVERKM